MTGERLDLDALLQEYIAEARAHCETGYVEGSFWATVDALQCIENLDSSALDYGFPGSALAATESSARADGSFDGVFGATVGLAWLRWRFGDARFAMSLRWLAGKTEGISFRDRVRYATLLCEIGDFTDDELAATTEVAHAVLKSCDNQVDLTTVANFGRLSGQPRLVTAASARLESLVSDGWIDIGVAGDALRIAASLAFQQQQGRRATQVSQRVVHAALIPLIRWMYEHDAADRDRIQAHMRIRGRALAGLAAFDDNAPLSFSSVLRLVRSTAATADKRLTRSARSELADHLRRAHAATAEDLRDATAELAATRQQEDRRRSRRRAAAAAAVVMTYLLVASIAAGIYLAGSPGQLIETVFVDGRRYHLFVGGAILTLAPIWLAYRQVALFRQSERSHDERRKAQP